MDNFCLKNEASGYPFNGEAAFFVRYLRVVINIIDNHTYIDFVNNFNLFNTCLIIYIVLSKLYRLLALTSMMTF